MYLCMLSFYHANIKPNTNVNNLRTCHVRTRRDVQVVTLGILPSKLFKLEKFFCLCLGKKGV